MMTLDSFINVVEHSKKGIWVTGLVKGEVTEEYIEITKSQNPYRWVRIPRSLIVSVIFHGNGTYVDQTSGQTLQGVVASLLLSEPNDAAAIVYAGLLKDAQESSSKSPCCSGRVGTLTPENSYSTIHTYQVPSAGFPSYSLPDVHKVFGRIYISIEVRCPKCNCYLASFHEYREASDTIYLGAIVAISYTTSCYNKGYCGSGSFDWQGTVTNGKIIYVMN